MASKLPACFFACLFREIICRSYENFVPLQCDSEEPGQELKRSGTSTLTMRHFKGHEAVIHRRRSPTLRKAPEKPLDYIKQ